MCVRVCDFEIAARVVLFRLSGPDTKEVERSMLRDGSMEQAQNSPGKMAGKAQGKNGVVCLLI